MIYAVEILDYSFIKIGFSASDDVSIRISQLQTGSPFEIKPIFTIPGSLRQEQTLHALLMAAFSSIHVPNPPNEWYIGKNPMFKGFMESLIFGFEYGVAYLAKFDQSMRASTLDRRLEIGKDIGGFEWPCIPRKDARKVHGMGVDMKHYRGDQKRYLTREWNPSKGMRENAKNLVP